MLDLQLVAMSATNVISWLRVVAGEDYRKMLFRWPSDAEVFDRHREFRVPVETMSTWQGVILDEIQRVSGKQIKEAYENANVPTTAPIRVNSPQAENGAEVVDNKSRGLGSLGAS